MLASRSCLFSSSRLGISLKGVEGGNRGGAFGEYPFKRRRNLPKGSRRIFHAIIINAPNTVIARISLKGVEGGGCCIGASTHCSGA